MQMGQQILFDDANAQSVVKDLELPIIYLLIPGRVKALLSTKGGLQARTSQEAGVTTLILTLADTTKSGYSAATLP